MRRLAVLTILSAIFVAHPAAFFKAPLASETTASADIPETAPRPEPASANPSSQQATTPSYYRMLNSYLAVKLIFGERAEDGKLVGAVWLRFENLTGKTVNALPVLLNPGLKIIEAKGPAGLDLRVRQKVAGIAGVPGLQLNTAALVLPRPLPDGKNIEITINYEGILLPLSGGEFAQVHDTLAGDFTILRLENFAYPVMSDASAEGLSGARTLQNYYQSVTLELPAGFQPAGNLAVVKKTLKGDRTEFELKSARPVPSLALPIAAYQRVTQGPITINHFPGDTAMATQLASEAQRTLTLFESWFGPAPEHQNLTISALPDGFGVLRLPGLIVQDRSAFNDKRHFPELYHEIAHLWHPVERALRPSHWDEGLATLMEALAARALNNDNDLAAFKAQRFDRARNHFANHADHAAFALADYGNRGVTELSSSVGTVFFSVLHDLMGHAAFLQFVSNMQMEFASTGADTGSFVAYLLEHMPNRRAEDFVEGWFLGSEAGNDIVTLRNYQALVEKYS